MIPDLFAAAGIAFLHSILPSHWVPFVLVAKRQGWPTRRLLGVVVTAGGGHALVTGLLGFALALAGAGAEALFEGISRYGAGGLILLFGLAYIVYDLRHLGHRHAPEGGAVGDALAHASGRLAAGGVGAASGEPAHASDRLAAEAAGAADAAPPGTADRAAATALVLLFALSPCVAMQPIFLAAPFRMGLAGAVLVAVANACVTIPVMTAMVLLARRGLALAETDRVRRYERYVVGVVLSILGLLVIADVGHSH